MSRSFSCPRCRSTVALGGGARTARCSGCGALLRVPSKVEPRDRTATLRGAGVLVVGLLLLVGSIVLSLDGKGTLFYGAFAVGLGMSICGAASLATGVDPAAINRFEA